MGYSRGSREEFEGSRVHWKLRGNRRYKCKFKYDIQAQDLLVTLEAELGKGGQREPKPCMVHFLGRGCTLALLLSGEVPPSNPKERL
jgi:hypothetical protein